MDASPFALLDTHGCLRLVTDVVHEDDTLCLALVCRALRDELGARFPACPRAGGRAVAKLAAMVTADGVLNLRYDGDSSDSSDKDGSGDDDGRLRARPEGIGRLAYLPGRGLRKLDLSCNRNLTALPAGLCALCAFWCRMPLSKIKTAAWSAIHRFYARAPELRGCCRDKIGPFTGEFP